ncbi:hypothetical protein L209DRAFT_731431 [Thermothelomyces heterothallicus CBS 203.75]
MSKRCRSPLAVAGRGVIAWLPAKRFIKPNPVPNLPPEVFNHPVLIYQTTSEQADVFLITSFHAGESLTGKFQTDAEFRSRQMPIDPAPPHPDNGVRLTLAAGRVWPKESYVSISLFTVPISILREETSGPWALSPESLAALDVVVAKLPHLRSWNGAPPKAEGRKAEEEAKKSVRDDGENEFDLNKEEVVGEAEEGWTTVAPKKKRGLSMVVTEKPRGHEASRRERCLSMNTPTRLGSNIRNHRSI